MTNELSSRRKTNSTYYILRFFKLFLSFNKDIPKFLHEELDRLSLFFENNSEVDWDFLGSISSNEDFRRMLFYFMDYGAATPFTLEKRLGVYTAKVYRFFKEMKKKGIIHLAIRMPTTRSYSGEGPRPGGPRAKVFKTVDATQDQIHAAVRLHRNLTSPKYRFAEEMAQLILDEYILVENKTEISRSKYIEFLREKNVKPYMIPDIVILSIPYFKEHGVTFIRQEGVKFRA